MMMVMVMDEEESGTRSRVRYELKPPKLKHATEI